MKNLPRVVLAGGVSGGHTFPLLAVARALREEFPEGIEFLFIGAQGAFDDTAFGAEGIPTKYVATGKMRRYFSLQNIVDPLKVPVGIVQSLWHLFRFLPDVVFAKGASGSVPVVIAAWLYRIPVIIQDSDAVAGRATRFLSRFATRIAIAYPSAHAYFPAKKTALLGNPVRQELLAGDRVRATQTFGLSRDKMTILCIGGSLGSRALNQALIHTLPKILSAGYQVIHQTGTDNMDMVEKDVLALGLPSTTGYVAKSFLSVEELADALALSHLVLSRAGANAISEFAATEKAAILVPLPNAANDEQRANAYEIAKIGGAVVMEEANIGENILFHKISELLESPELRATMGAHLRQFYHPNAAKDIALGIKEYIK